ncbi:GNAT family N-acetyltransferase [Raineyella sp.]|uniref:GNAT family N-acetyltransferase n=1 Tax=Raineyella sp. TaxID=1911550 RepID=UPI002B1F3302|nr:GNAT family N-acetyltransferase [Raineyella sp.]MEA5155425.1 GNAT family N-acetyltransferase [Raineyella sp.]
MPDINIRFNPERSRWEALLDGDEIGFLDYQVNCGIVEMSRTGVDRLEGQDTAAIGTELIRAGLEQAREDGLKVLATSPEVEEFLTDHRDDYRDLR